MKPRSIAMKCIILLCVAYPVYQLAHWTIGFTYFTMLSNLFAAGVCLLQLAAMAAGRRADWLKPAKYLATVSILVTLLIYLTVLGPLTPGGLLAAYRLDHWSSLFLHLLAPAMTVADFFLNDRDYPWRPAHALWAVVPPILYFALILALGQLGLRWEGGRMAAPYLFLNYDTPAGWFGWRPETAGFTTLGVGVFYVVIALSAVFVGLGTLVLRLAGMKRKD